MTTTTLTFKIPDQTLPQLDNEWRNKVNIPEATEEEKNMVAVLSFFRNIPGEAEFIYTQKLFPHLSYDEIYEEVSRGGNVAEIIDRLSLWHQQRLEEYLELSLDPIEEVEVEDTDGQIVYRIPTVEEFLADDKDADQYTVTYFENNPEEPVKDYGHVLLYRDGFKIWTNPKYVNTEEDPVHAEMAPVNAPPWTRLGTIDENGNIKPD